MEKENEFLGCRVDKYKDAILKHKTMRNDLEFPFFIPFIDHLITELHSRLEDIIPIYPSIKVLLNIFVTITVTSALTG